MIDWLDMYYDNIEDKDIDSVVTLAAPCFS